MVKIWFKTITDKKLLTSNIYHFEGKFDESLFDGYVRFACDELDIPSPIVMERHVSNFIQFNICRFDQTDFVESIGFEQLTLENCPI